MKILAIDQDMRSLENLEQSSRAILAERLTHFARATSLHEASAQLTASAFDVVLLDPPAANRDALARLSHHPERARQTIVVSADKALAIRAFEHGVLDFVPKPVNRDRLAQALMRVTPTAATESLGEQLIAVRRMGRIDLLPLNDLLYVEGADKYTELVLTNGQRSFHDQCLGKMEATLPRTFVRIHKSYLVRFSEVLRLLVLKGSRYFAVLKNGERLPVGRSRYAQIKSRLL